MTHSSKNLTVQVVTPLWKDGKRTINNRCCSATEPCMWQKEDPNTICDICDLLQKSNTSTAFREGCCMTPDNTTQPAVTAEYRAAWTAADEEGRLALLQADECGLWLCQGGSDGDHAVVVRGWKAVVHHYAQHAYDWKTPPSALVDAERSLTRDVDDWNFGHNGTASFQVSFEDGFMEFIRITDASAVIPAPGQGAPVVGAGPDEVRADGRIPLPAMSGWYFMKHEDPLSFWFYLYRPDDTRLRDPFRLHDANLIIRAQRYFAQSQPAVLPLVEQGGAAGFKPGDRVRWHHPPVIEGTVLKHNGGLVKVQWDTGEVRRDEPAKLRPTAPAATRQESARSGEEGE